MVTKLRIIPITSEGRGRLDVMKLTRDLKAAMTSTTANGQRFIARYPSQRLTKSGYRRTGTLKRSWSSSVRVSSRQIIGIVGSNSNIAPYNKFVQGTAKDVVKIFPQAGWRGVDDLSKVLENELDKRVDGLMEAFVR